MKYKLDEATLVGLINKATKKVLKEWGNEEQGEKDLNTALYSFDLTVEKIQRWGNYLLKIKEAISSLIPRFIKDLAYNGVVLNGITYTLDDVGIVLHFASYTIDQSKIDQDVLADYQGEEEALVDSIINDVEYGFRSEMGSATIERIYLWGRNRTIEFRLIEELNPIKINETIPDF